VRPVTIQAGVIAQIADIFKGVPRFRIILGDIQNDLNNHLPNNLAYYQSNRAHGRPPFFYYDRTYALDPHAFNFRMLRFVVRDSDPSMLEVIYVVVLA
jgi:hypothetical protein